MLRVLIADDSALIREALRQVVETYPAHVIGEGATGADAVQLAEQEQPDIVLLDISMPVMNGIMAAEHLHARWPRILIIMVTERSDSQYVERALGCGARGYVLKRCVSSELLTAMRIVLAGESYISPQLASVVRHSDATL